MMICAGNSTNNLPGVIILQGTQTTARSATGFGYTGVEVYNADGVNIALPWYNDDGSRTTGQSLAKCIADGLRAGYRIQHIDGLNVWLVKD